MPHTSRAPWHDYRSRCIYMLTLRKSASVPDFGQLVGEKIELSETGRFVKRQIGLIPLLDRAFRVLQFSIMPDHVHILLFVQSILEESLGKYIARFKIGVNQRAGGIPVFEEGFNDQILMKERSLDTLFNYIRDNPRRLAVRKAHPEYFRRVNGLDIEGKRYSVYGNLFLLHNPFREQVVIHRADNADVRAANRDRWLYTAANGGVLVSPFISPAEKAVRTEAEEAGAKIILITNEQMGERYKPTGREFRLCESGRLLIVSVPGPGSLTRRACLEMNALAKAIAANKPL